MGICTRTYVCVCVEVNHKCLALPTVLHYLCLNNRISPENKQQQEASAATLLSHLSLFPHPPPHSPPSWPNVMAVAKWQTQLEASSQICIVSSWLDSLCSAISSLDDYISRQTAVASTSRRQRRRWEAAGEGSGGTDEASKTLVQFTWPSSSGQLSALSIVQLFLALLLLTTKSQNIKRKEKLREGAREREGRCAEDDGKMPH